MVKVVAGIFIEVYCISEFFNFFIRFRILFDLFYTFNFLRLLRCGNLIAKRDIVQFVELRKFLVPGVRGEPPSWSKELLAKVRNIVQFMELRKFLVPGVRGEPPSWSKELLAKVRNIV
jgi:hypothetical protein